MFVSFLKTVIASKKVRQKKFINKALGEINASDKSGELRCIGDSGKIEGFNARKYSDARKYLSEFHNLAINLNLVDAPDLRILDIGSGAGWLECVLKQYGHSVYGIDVEDEVLDKIATVIGTSRHIQPVVSNEKMDVQGPYDLIVSKGAFFDRGERLDTGSYSWVWALGDYLFF